MEQGQPAPPQELRPWYYKNWFLFPAFILGWPVPGIPLLWPMWSILIIRSPWHRGFISGTLAWAMLMSGGAMIWLGILDSRVDPVLAVAMAAPGLVLTVITQTLWTKYRRELPAGEPQQAGDPGEVKGPPRSRRGGLQRRRRRKGSRPGKYSRHPF
jgi:hypothetical protein